MTVTTKVNLRGISELDLITPNAMTTSVSAGITTITLPTTVTLAGDVTGSSDANTVAKIQGTTVTGTTGTGAVVLANTPTLITPIIGAATGTSLNVSGTLTAGTSLIVNGGTALTTTNQTGTGSLVLAVSPALTGTPTVPTAAPLTNTTQAASTAFVTAAVAAASPTLAGDVTGPVGSNTVSKIQGTTVSGTTGTSNVVFSNTPTLVTPVIGAATGTSLALGGGTALTTTNQSGTGNLVLVNTPTLITPVIGAATGTSLSVSGQLTSTIAIGTAPLVVTSTTNVANLNASSLGGTTFAAPGAIGGTTPAAGTFTALVANTSLVVNGGTALTTTNQSGTGSLVLVTGATLVTPTLGVASATELDVDTITLDHTNKDVILTRAAAATLQFGAANSAAPVAQTVQAQGSRGGTDTNIGGGNLTIASGDGTGTGAVSSVIIKAPALAASGTTQQTITTSATFLATGVIVAGQINISAGNALRLTTAAGTPQIYSGDSNNIILNTGATGFVGISTAETGITRVGTGQLNLGLPNAAAPVAQVLGAQGSRAGTDTNVGGANLTIQSGIGTGTGTVSSITFKTPVVVGSGTGAQTQTTTLTLAAATGLSLPILGNGLNIKTGTNSRIGTGTLSGGTLVIANTSITANTRIFLTDTGGGIIANIGSLYVSATSIGVSFTVSSNNALDTSTFNWLLLESIP